MSGRPPRPCRRESASREAPDPKTTLHASGLRSTVCAERRAEARVSRILCALEGASRSFLWEAGCPAPRATYPEARRPQGRARRATRRRPPYLVLLRVGFSVPRSVTGRAVRSYRTVSPLPNGSRRSAVCSLLHFPSRRHASPLASTLPVGVRTFLDESSRTLASPSRARRDRIRASARRRFYRATASRSAFAA